MSALVWVLMLYSSATVTLLTVTEGIPVTCGMIYNILCFMALACHAKTSLTDPGSVPIAAIPSERQRLLKDSHSMCGQCQTFKPPMSHHCRICNRCISRMDHHCPWVRLTFFITFLRLHFIIDIIKNRCKFNFFRSIPSRVSFKTHRSVLFCSVLFFFYFPLSI